MLNYDKAAVSYDATRGGEPRADAAAAAVLSLVPPSAHVLLDVGCGTGLVTERLSRPGLCVLGVDASYGMLSLAAERIGSRVLLADAGRLPVPNEAVDAVSMVWLLHVVGDSAAAMIAEAARTLRPGGVFITTVDKDAAHDVSSDIDELLAPYRTAVVSDRSDVIASCAARHALMPVGEARFTGHGLGRSPMEVADAFRRGRFRMSLPVDAEGVEPLAAALEALPEPERPRVDPEYQLLALRKEA